MDGQKVPLIIQKSDGGFGYATTDMAALRQRLTDEKAEWVIYVTDVGQSQHFQMLFAAAKKAGWLAEGAAAPRIDHVVFGLVLGEDGQKFKTRSGDVSMSMFLPFCNTLLVWIIFVWFGIKFHQ